MVVVEEVVVVVGFLRFMVDGAVFVGALAAVTVNVERRGWAVESVEQPARASEPTVAMAAPNAIDRCAATEVWGSEPTDVAEETLVRADLVGRIKGLIWAAARRSQPGIVMSGRTLRSTSAGRTVGDCSSI